MDELEKKTVQHFTAPEFVEFLGLEVEDIFDRCQDIIESRYGEIATEVCFEFETTDNDS